MAIAKNVADRFPEIPSAAGAALLIEQELESEKDPELARWLKRLEQDGALVEASWFGTSLVDRDRFWRFRHFLPELANDTKRLDGSLKLASDCAVPAENHREMLSFYREQLEHMFPEQYVIFDPIGDAHLHVNILAKTADSERAAALLIDFAQEAVARGGTVSAEPGLGWPGTFWSANGNGKL